VALAGSILSPGSPSGYGRRAARRGRGSPERTAQWMSGGRGCGGGGRHHGRYRGMPLSPGTSPRHAPTGGEGDHSPTADRSGAGWSTGSVTTVGNRPNCSQRSAVTGWGRDRAGSRSASSAGRDVGTLRECRAGGSVEVRTSRRVDRRRRSPSNPVSWTRRDAAPLAWTSGRPRLSRLRNISTVSRVEFDS